MLTRVSEGRSVPDTGGTCPGFYRYDELFPGASGNPGRFFYNGAK